MSERPDPHEAAPTSTVGAGAVVLQGSRILLVRLTYGWARGRWVIPNGALWACETLAECARRELREETGLAGEPGALVAVRSLASARGTDTFIACAMQAAGEPHPDGREVDAASFFDRAGISALEATSTIVRIHRLIAEHVLPGPSPTPLQYLPAKDREGNPATATLYLL